MFMEIKARNQFQTLINACVSHELRNPLNSIISKNIEKSALYQELSIILSQLLDSHKDDSRLNKCLEIINELNEGKKVQ